MSIVVTCDCTMEYRLPDRYAGKRCRCRECGGRIEVPRSTRARTSGEEKRKRRKKKSKTRTEGKTEAKAETKAKAQAEKRRKRAKARAASTTRRLRGAEQEREIISDRDALHSSQGRRKRRPVSESMHQLTPMRSGDRLAQHVGLTPPPGKRRRKAKTQPKRTPNKARVEKKKKSKSKSKKSAAGRETTKIRTRGKGSETAKIPTRGKDRVTAKTRARGKGSETAKIRARGDKKLSAKTSRPGRGKARTFKRRQHEEEGSVRASAKASPTTHALYAVVAIVGVLCLGIGLVVGGVFNGKTDAAAVGGLDTKFTDVVKMKKARNWAAAKLAVDALEAELKLADDQDALGKLYGMRSGVDKMVQILALEDDETRLTALCDFSADEDPTVRAGCVWELRGICEQEDARRAILNLTRDPDAFVATAAAQAMVQAGGPESIPFLLDAIESTAATGGKQGDVALARAVEIDDPAVVPVLLKVLEVRPKAPADALRQVLNRLAELGTPECVPAIKPFLEHSDAEVAEVAKAVIEELGS